MVQADTIDAPSEAGIAGRASRRSGVKSAEATSADTVVDEGTRTTRPLPVVVSRVGPLLQSTASLLWIPQAALLAISVGNIAAGNGTDAILLNAGGALVFGVAKSILDAVGSRMAFKEARALLSDHRGRAIATLASRSPLDAARPASGFAASTLAEQAEAIVPYLARFQPARLRATVVPIAILLCVLTYSWAAALVLLVAAPLIPIFMALVGWRAKEASEAQLAELGGMNAFLLDRLRGLATIRSLEAVDATALRLRADAQSLRARTMAVLKIAFLSSAVLELFAALGVAMVAVYVGFHLLGQLPFGAWGHTLSLSEGLFILLLAPAFFEPLRDLSSVWHDRAAGEAALSALHRLSEQGAEFLGARSEQKPLPSAESAAPSVRIENLRFGHTSKSEPVFDKFSLDVAPGEHVALLAQSGGGKSTLLALLAGLTVPESGHIFIAGQLLSARNAAQLRRGIAWIGQHPHIFADTLVGNVTLGRAGTDPESVRQALNLVGLEDAAERRGSAPIGENGVGLSGGEASRLALARIAATPESTLILADEPTAHLDAATARSISDALITLARDRTLIVATHDPVFAARMDRIVRLTPTPLEDAA